MNSFIKRWNAWMFAPVSGHVWLDRFKTLWAAIIFLKFAGLGRLWRGSLYSVLRPPFSDVTTYPLDSYQVAWPGLEWLPIPGFTAYCAIYLACITLAIFYAGRVYRPLVGPLLALLMASSVAISQLNYSHHLYQLLSVLLILVLTDLRPALTGTVLPWRLIQLLMTMIYCCSAISKIHPGWLSGEVFSSYLAHGEISGGLGANVVLAIGPSILAWSVVGLELALAVGLWFRSSSRVFLVLALLFHIGLNLCMDVTTFSLQACAVWVCLAGFHRAPLSDSSCPVGGEPSDLERGEAFEQSETLSGRYPAVSGLPEDEAAYWRRFGLTVSLAFTMALGYVYRTTHTLPRFYRSAALDSSVDLQSGTTVIEQWLDHHQADPFLSYPGTADLRIYQEGHPRFHKWRYDRSWSKALDRLSQNSDLAHLANNQTAYLTLGYDYAPCAPQQLDVSELGITGLEIHSYRKTVDYFPIGMLVGELSPRQALLREGCIKKGQLEREYFRYYSFKTLQYEISKGPKGWQVRQLLRGQPPTVAQFDEKAIDALRLGMGDYFSRQIRAGDGNLEYSYRPISGQPSDKGLLLVRPCLASWALASLAAPKGSDNSQALSYEADFHRHLQAFFAKYYQSDQSLGWLEHNKLRDLGAAALVSVAMRTSPSLNSEENAKLPYLDRAVDGCWLPTGRFRTAIGAASEFEINQNFYPGEALLAWATRQEFSAQRKEQFLKSFRYYRDYYRAHKLPAFIPWHTMAYCKFLKRFQNAEMQAFVFEMNDDLVNGFQPVGSFADLDGAFYRNSSDPKLRQGVHASATGVYLDGLADAFELARRSGDAARAKLYGRAIVRGVGHLQGLQYRQENSKVFPSAIAQHIRGGLKSTPWSASLRVDNEAHAILALGKIARLGSEIEASINSKEPKT